ncbi:MAG: hypothetical protein ABUK20_11805 [Anaerolineales bacterium]
MTKLTQEQLAVVHHPLDLHARVLAVAGHATRIIRKSSENCPRLFDQSGSFDEELIPKLFILRLHIGSPLVLWIVDSYGWATFLSIIFNVKDG